MREICSKLKIKTLELEAATRGVLCKKVFLEILHNSQENTYANSLCFNKVARPATLLKKRLLTQVFFCEFWEISKNTFYTEHLWTTASTEQCQ